MLRLTPSGLGCVAVAVGGFELASLAHAVWLQVIACCSIGMLAASLIGLLMRPAVDLGIETPAQLRVAEPFETTVRVRNPSSRSTGPIVLTHFLLGSHPLVEPALIYLDALPPGDSRNVTVSRAPINRGHGKHHRLDCLWVGPFGLFERRRRSCIHIETDVAPAPAPPLPLPDFGGGADAVAGPLRPGLDVDTVRPYRTGDSTRHVHWRTTARTGRLSVLERAEPGGGALGVVLAGESGDPAFEAALAVAAATATAATRAGLAVYCWVQQSGGGCQGILTEATVLTPFIAADRPAPPETRAVPHLLGHLGAGGHLLLVAPNAPARWLADVTAQAAAVGIAVIDVVDSLAVIDVVDSLAVIDGVDSLAVVDGGYPAAGAP